MTFVLSPPGQHVPLFLTPGYPMFFISIGPNSGQQKEIGANQKIRQTWLSISLCFHLSLLKFTLPIHHIYTARSTALQTHVISSGYWILSSVPLHYLHHFYNSWWLHHFSSQTKLEQSVVSSHLRTHRTSYQPHPLLKLPSSPSVPSLRQKYPNISSPAILQHRTLSIIRWSSHWSVFRGGLGRGGIHSTSTSHWGSPGLGSWTPPLLYLHYITGSHHTSTLLILPLLSWWHTALSLISTRWSNGSCTYLSAWQTSLHGWKNINFTSTWQRPSFLSSLPLQLNSMISPSS